MKNCQIIIRKRNHHSVSYIFDDYRVAQAVINILDNVAEACIDGKEGFRYQLIKKDIYEDEAATKDDVISGKIEYLKYELLSDIYMSGVNMAGEYQGCYVRYKDIENLVNVHFKKVMSDEADN